MPPSPLRSALQPRGLSSGAKAGVSVGTILGAAFVVLCLWPFVARYVRRRRRRRDVSSESFTVDELPAVGGSPMAVAHYEPNDRRMSRDSYGIGPDSEPMHRPPTKELALESFGSPLDAIPHPPLTSVSGIAQTTASETPSPFRAPPRVDTNVARMVASCESRGHSGSYYNPNIPTEAFGLVNWEDKPTPGSGPSISSTKFSAASWFDSILRRATTSRKSTSAPSTQPRPPSQPGDPVTSLGLSESPTDLEAPAGVLLPSSRSSRSSGEGNRALDLGGIDFPPASPPPAPPVQASPGTVNPMEVMGATTMTEQTWRTNAELMSLSRSPPSSSSPGALSPDVSQYAASPSASSGDAAAGLPSQSPQESTPEPGLPDLYPAAHHLDGDDQSNGQTFDLIDPILDAFLKDEIGVPTAAYDVVPPLNDQTPPYARHRYTSSADVSYTDNSAYSTPFHAPSPYGASTLNTPDTRISDTTPSPNHMISPEIKHGYSPNPGLSPSPQTPQVLSCDKCNQKFDQPHKLNHHKRYHDRPHVCERPGCGRRFGTKTHLDRHVNDKHEQTRRYHCPEQTCLYSRHGGKSFPRKDNLRRHMMNIHGQSPQPDQEFEFVDIVMEGS